MTKTIEIMRQLGVSEEGIKNFVYSNTGKFASVFRQEFKSDDERHSFAEQFLEVDKKRIRIAKAKEQDLYVDIPWHKIDIAEGSVRIYRTEVGLEVEDENENYTEDLQHFGNELKNFFG